MRITRLLRSCGWLVPLAALALTRVVLAADNAAPKPGADILIKMEERGFRAAGIGVTTIERERVQSDLALPGTVAIPQQQIRIVAAPAAGLVEEMLIAADEHATAGQPIARVRSPTVVEAQLQFLSVISDDALSADKLRRSQLLFEGRALPERELRVAETESVRAKANLDERTQILALMGMTDADIDQLRKTRKITSTVTVYAPIAGTVVTRHVSVGERVDATAPLFTIAQLEPLWVNIQVPAARLPNIVIGAPVVLPASGAKGRVIRIARTVDAPTQSATAVAEIDSAGSRVRPGLAVTVNVRIDQGGEQAASDLWSVPATSVVRHRDRTWVFVRSSEGFRARPVQVVAEATRGVLIRADLAASDQVAVRGILSLSAALAEADKE